MRATIENPAGPREGWLTVTFPRQKASKIGKEGTFVLDDGREFRAVRGRLTPSKAIYRIQATLDGKEKVTGTLTAKNHPDVLLGGFTPHPWVVDDLSALVPIFGGADDSVRVNAVGVPMRWRTPDWNRSEQWTEAHKIEETASHQRWFLHQRVPGLGLHMLLWMDVLHKDPVIQVTGKIVWSDRLDPENNKTFSGFALMAGEAIKLDFGTRHGIQPLYPLDTGRRDGRKSLVQMLNTGSFTLRDGSGLPFSGSMLCYTRDPDLMPADPEDLSDPAALSLASLHAAYEAPMVGVCHDWDGEFLANGWIPRFKSDRATTRHLETVRNQVWDRFQEDQKRFAGWFATRDVGLQQNPAQAGDQDDFGATKGTLAVSLGDPRWIRYAQYSVQAELFRGVHHYEKNGKILTAANHPNWTTWSQLTHFSTDKSPARLGKDAVYFQPGPGWYAYDDQHYSVNNLAAYLCLTDDALMENHVAHMVEADLAQDRLRWPSGAGATRAQGRVVQAWEQLYSAVSPSLGGKLKQLVDARLERSLQVSSLGVSGPMKVLSWGNPDRRKVIFLNGELAPWTSMWELGLAIVALYPTVQRYEREAEGDAEPGLALTVVGRMFDTICETLARFAFFQDMSSGESVWWQVDDILWTGGQAPPEEGQSSSRQHVVRRGAGSVGQWTFAALLVCRERLGEEHPLHDKLQAYIELITKDQEASQIRTAEWWAAVESVA